MMFERKGCLYCLAWKRQIGPGYAESAAGRVAPLVVVDMDGPYPDGLALARRPVVTPTFVLMRNGMELGRIEGYSRPDAFYPALETLLAG
ncbi:SoxS protein [Paracoccus caeni]|uniref:SoxS protein n=2 Tax=Paracoccus caeni TaxID=657651 RepID=A0A934VZB7_9RHOB|nr:SoxS protein [Paracoccus caeni]